MTALVVSTGKTYDSEIKERLTPIISTGFNDLNAKLTASSNLNNIVDAQGVVTVDLRHDGKAPDWLDRKLPAFLKKFMLKKWPDNINGLTPQLVEENLAYKDVQALLEKAGHSIESIEIQKSHQDIGFKKLARAATVICGTAAVATAPSGGLAIFFGGCTAAWGALSKNNFEATKPHQIKLHLSDPQP